MVIGLLRLITTMTLLVLVGAQFRCMFHTADIQCVVVLIVDDIRMIYRLVSIQNVIRRFTERGVLLKTRLTRWSDRLNAKRIRWNGHCLTSRG